VLVLDLWIWSRSSQCNFSAIRYEDRSKRFGSGRNGRVVAGAIGSKKLAREVSGLSKGTHGHKWVYGAKRLIEQLQKHFVRGMAEGSLGSLGVVKPRGAVRGEGALRVYCSKQLRKLHLGPLDREGAYGGIWSCTGSHTCRVAFSPLVLTPSNWWLGVALMTTVHSGRRGALCTPASYPYSPRLRDLDSTLRPNHAGAQSRRHLCHHPSPSRYHTARLRIASQTTPSLALSACDRIHDYRSYPT